MNNDVTADKRYADAIESLRSVGGQEVNVSRAIAAVSKRRTRPAVGRLAWVATAAGLAMAITLTPRTSGAKAFQSAIRSALKMSTCHERQFLLSHGGTELESERWIADQRLRSVNYRGGFSEERFNGSVQYYYNASQGFGRIRPAELALYAGVRTPGRSTLFELSSIENAALAGHTSIAGRDCDVYRYSQARWREDGKVYVDTASQLPVRQEFTDAFQHERHAVVYEFPSNVAPAAYEPPTEAKFPVYDFRKQQEELAAAVTNSLDSTVVNGKAVKLRAVLWGQGMGDILVLYTGGDMPYSHKNNVTRLVGSPAPDYVGPLEFERQNAIAVPSSELPKVNGEPVYAVKLSWNGPLAAPSKVNLLLPIWSGTNILGTAQLSTDHVMRTAFVDDFFPMLGAKKVPGKSLTMERQMPSVIKP